MHLPGSLLCPSSKNKKNPPREKFFIFKEMKLSNSYICYIFSKKKAFLIFPEIKPAISYKIYETNSSFHVKKHTTGKV